MRCRLAALAEPTMSKRVRVDYGEISTDIADQQRAAVKPGCDATVMPWFPNGGTPLIILGLYPASKCNQNNATEREMWKLISRSNEQDQLESHLYTDFSWIDLCVLSSDTVNAAIDQTIILNFARNDEMVADYHRRFTIQVECYLELH